MWPTLLAGGQSLRRTLQVKAGVVRALGPPPSTIAEMEALPIACAVVVNVGLLGMLGWIGLHPFELHGAKSDWTFVLLLGSYPAVNLLAVSFRRWRAYGYRGVVKVFYFLSGFLAVWALLLGAWEAITRPDAVVLLVTALFFLPPATTAWALRPSREGQVVRASRV